MIILRMTIRIQIDSRYLATPKMAKPWMKLYYLMRLMHLTLSALIKNLNNINAQAGDQT